MRSRAASTVLAVAVVGALALVPALSASAKPSPFNVKNFKNSLNRTKNLTYEAEYTSGGSGQSSTVTIAQSPPKSAFVTSSGSVINTGNGTYYCSSGSGGSGNSGNSGSSGSGNSGNSGASKVTCLSTSMSNPLLGVMNAFSSQAVMDALGSIKTGIIARVLGIKVTYSSATFAGQPSNCVSISRKSSFVKYCVTKQGVLSYTGTSKSQYFKLTTYSSKPPASLFQIPSNATVNTLPAGLGGSTSG